MDDLNNLTNEQLGAMIQMLQKTLNDQNTAKETKSERPNKFLDMPEFLHAQKLILL